MAAVKVASIRIIEWDLEKKKWICHAKVTEATNKLDPVEQQPTEESAIFSELLTNLQMLLRQQIKSFVAMFSDG